MAPGGPSECRCAISRAYYAAFHVAVDFLRFIRIKVCDSAACHVVTMNGLGNSGETDLATVGTYLGTLYDERAHADYEMTKPRAESLSQAELAATMSRDAIVLLDQRRQAYSLNPAQGFSVAATIWAWSQQSGQQKKLWKMP